MKNEVNNHISVAETDMQEIFVLLNEALEPKVNYSGNHYQMAQDAIHKSQQKIVAALALLVAMVPQNHPLHAEWAESLGMRLPLGDSSPRSPKQALVNGRLLQALANMVAMFPDDSELQETYASIVAMNEYDPAPFPF
ncbi:MAG: hypothetical protein KF770_23660 [Anaerolineae bacterium]|nr:hypothetical protein [Anaerolineae bacterium]